MTLSDTLAKLVSIDSVSSRSNSEIIDFLEERCAIMGFSSQRFSYLDDLGTEKTNLIAVAGADLINNPWIELALVGHSDTVPYDPNWLQATQLTEQDGKLYGRGACDTKGFIAAALTAVQRLNLASLKRPLALIFTADEELGLFGAKHLAQLNPVKVRYSIVGEPTSLQPIRAGKGYSLAEVIVQGREAHSAYPALGSSAVFGAARLISRIEAISKDITKTRHVAFDPPHTTLNVGLIKGGTAKNVIAGECRFTLEWRPVPGQDSDQVLQMIDEAIQEERRTDPQFECRVDPSRSDAGFETPANSTLVTFLEKTTGQKAGTVSFGTEAAQMMRLGGEAVVLGPGDIRVAHRTGEFVAKDELEHCTEIITLAIKEFCF